MATAKRPPIPQPKRPTQTHRVTVRLPDALYERLQIFAAGRSQHGEGAVSQIVREALEAYVQGRVRWGKRAKKEHADADPLGA